MQGRKFLFEEMKDQRTWVGVFFLMMRSGKLPFFLYPRRTFKLVALIAILNAKLSMGINCNCEWN
jgi:hypothetical protein